MQALKPQHFHKHVIFQIVVVEHDVLYPQQYKIVVFEYTHYLMYKLLEGMLLLIQNLLEFHIVDCSKHQLKVLNLAKCKTGLLFFGLAR